MFIQLSQIEGAALSTWGNSDTWQKNLSTCCASSSCSGSTALRWFNCCPCHGLSCRSRHSPRLTCMIALPSTFCCITSLKPASTLAKRCQVMSLPITFARSSTWPRGSLWTTPRAWDEERCGSHHAHKHIRSDVCLV